MKISLPITLLITLVSVNIEQVSAKKNDDSIGQTDAMRYTANVQPVIPFKLTDEWTLVIRTIVPFIHAEPTVQGGPSLGDLGDIQQSFFFAPQPTANGVIWGTGSVFAYPTATDDRLRSEKFGLGPAGLILPESTSRKFRMGIAF